MLELTTMKWFWTLVIGTLVIVSMVWAVLFQWGQLQNFAEFDHPFFKDLPLPLKISTYSSSGSGTDQKDLNLQQDSLAGQKQWQVYWIEIQDTADGQLFFDPEISEASISDRMKSSALYVGDKSYFYKFSDLAEHFPNIKLFAEICQEHPNTKWILNIVDNSVDIHLHIVTAIDSCDLADRVLIQSPNAIVLTSVRRERPRWLIGTSIPDLNKLLSYSSIGLGNLAPIKADVFVTPVKWANRIVVNSEVISTAINRRMKVVVGPVAARDELLFVEENNFLYDILVISAKINE